MMRRWPVWPMVGGFVALLLMAALAWSRSDRGFPPRKPGDRPALMLITTLPLVFPEEFTLQGSGSKALKALETRYRVVPVGTTDAGSLRQGRLLLMAHPLAQPAEDLVALDQWVRSGGRLLLLADPKLEWPSNRPLGDKLRPPPSFADTGLLAHWGLRLEDSRDLGPVRVGGGHNAILYISPGRFLSENRHCELSRAGIVAECRIGKGKVTVVADADFLNADAAEASGNSAENQMRELIELLAALEP